MKYFLFLPEKDNWSDIVYTVEELRAMPDIKDDSLICESEGERRTLYFSQIQQPVIDLPQYSTAEPTRRETNNPIQKEYENAVPRRKKSSIEALLLKEKLYTYRLVQIACRFIFFFSISSILSLILFAIFYALSVESPVPVLATVLGIIIPLIIARSLGSDRKR